MSLKNKAEQNGGTLMSQALEQLRYEIVRGQLAPDTKLNIDELRDRLGVSHSPLREALSRLTADGLVRLESQKGFRVAPASLADLLDTTKTRQILESAAIKLAIAKGDDAWEGEIVSAYHRLEKSTLRGEFKDAKSREEWEKVHDAFHAALISACGLHWLMEFRNTLYRQMARYRYLWLDLDVYEDVDAEHRQLMDAVLGRDAKKASALLEEHIALTYEMVSKIRPA